MSYRRAAGCGRKSAGLGVGTPVSTPLAALDELLHWGRVPFLNFRVLYKRNSKEVIHTFPILPHNLAYGNLWKLRMQIWGRTELSLD